MSSRTSRWAAQVRPGPPAANSRAPSIGPSPTVYPESSVSNPDASRYTGRPSRTRSASIDHPPSQHESHYTSSSRSSPRHSTTSSSRSSPRHSTSRSSRASTPTPSTVYQAPPGQPIIARTSDSRGHTDSYVIVPARGHRVEIVYPSPVRASSAAPHSRSSYYASSSSRSPTREKPLLRRLLDKVGDTNSRRSSSVSHSSASSYRSSRTRRNSTGDDSHDWTVLSAENPRSDYHSRGSVDSGGRGSVITVTTRGRTYDIISA